MKEQRDEDHWWAAPLGAGIVALTFGTLALVAAGGWAWFAKFLEGTASGWAQALGGVLAVVGAYKIGNTQVAAGRALEEDRRRHDEMRRIATIDALLSNALGLCSSFHNAWEEDELGFAPQMPVAYVQDCMRLLHAVDPFDCPAPDVVIYLAQLPRQLDHFANSYTEYLTIMSHSHPEKIFAQGAALRKDLDETLTLLRDARAECSVASARIVARA